MNKMNWTEFVERLTSAQQRFVINEPYRRKRTSKLTERTPFDIAHGDHWRLKPDMPSDAFYPNDNDDNDDGDWDDS